MERVSILASPERCAEVGTLAEARWGSRGRTNTYRLDPMMLAHIMPRTEDGIIVCAMIKVGSDQEEYRINPILAADLEAHRDGDRATNGE